MNVWVGIWHSKYGTDVQVASAEHKVYRHFAQKCCDNYWDNVHNHLPIKEAQEACAEFILPRDAGSHTSKRILDSWKKWCGPDDRFEFFEKEVTE